MSVKKRSRDSSSGGGGSGGGSSRSSGGAAVAPGCITSFFKRRNSRSGLEDMSPTDSRFVVATDSTSSVFPVTKEDRAFALRGHELAKAAYDLGDVVEAQKISAWSRP